MSVRKEYIRGAKRDILASVTTGYSRDTSSVVPDENNHIFGRTNDLFNTTRAEHRNLVFHPHCQPRLANQAQIEVLGMKILSPCTRSSMDGMLIPVFSVKGQKGNSD
jgi:hypothetical protein